ncbi:MAG TPA: putative zinc-binding metallopeptidase [Xanthomonadales bacterium]|nr:putative zinc-binding metallopeptidase [Xanthomonadales bacterium]
MRPFKCHCGNPVYFENTACQKCQRQLGFDPDTLQLLALDLSTDGRLTTPEGSVYRRCSNFHRYYNCNWLLHADDPQDLCFSCRLNDVIPALDRPDNLKLWTRMEEAKRRLLYSLLLFRLPLSGNHEPHFKFLEDSRRNPDVYETFVTTGRWNNTITINIAEADDAARHAAREEMHELYRTVLGHLRHEIGHFYFNLLTSRFEDLEECRRLFGDERTDYQAALQKYYDQGPPADWHQNHISAYAAAHPAEDFAETFAHYLHITDALESARAGGLSVREFDQTDTGWIDEWIKLVITLNEITRSLGVDDAYPFLLSENVKTKLALVHRLVGAQSESHAVDSHQA